MPRTPGSKLFWTGQSVVPAISSIRALDFMTTAVFPNDRNNRVDTFKALNGGSGQGYDDFIPTPRWSA